MLVNAKPPIYEDSGECSSSDGDYAVPPDAYEPYAVVGAVDLRIREDGMQTTLVASSNQVTSCIALSVVNYRILMRLFWHQ